MEGGHDGVHSGDQGQLLGWLLRRGHPHAVDGEIGRVEGFVVDPADNKVTHVLLQEGHMWGRKEVAIPVSAVASIDAGIRLNITKQQVEDLPPLHTGHP